jgi:hypothetical protein
VRRCHPHFQIFKAGVDTTNNMLLWVATIDNMRGSDYYMVDVEASL